MKPEKKERLVTIPVTFEFSIYAVTYTKEEAAKDALNTLLSMSYEERVEALDMPYFVCEDGTGGTVGRYVVEDGTGGTIGRIIVEEK